MTEHSEPPSNGAPPSLQPALSLYKALTTHEPALPHVRKSLATLDAALRLYTSTNLCVAFNGGKDATAVLHLTLAALARRQDEQLRRRGDDGANESTKEGSIRMEPPVLHCLYVESAPGDNFEEVDAFVERTLTAQGAALRGHRVRAGMREGISQFVAERSASACAFVLGTRRADPHGGAMHPFEPSSPGWAPFMRVNPILDWRYADVWAFLREFAIPFCPLYERGYTSLGSVRTTMQNPALRRERDAVVSYAPAWLLEDESLERAGRSK